jgi:hypothetical protein
VLFFFQAGNKQPLEQNISADEIATEMHAMLQELHKAQQETSKNKVMCVCELNLSELHA